MRQGVVETKEAKLSQSVSLLHVTAPGPVPGLLLTNSLGPGSRPGTTGQVRHFLQKRIC